VETDSHGRALKRDWKLFVGLTFLFSFGFAVYSGVFQNFLRDVMHAGPQMLGNLESLREIPGLLTAISAGVLVALAESRLAALGLLIAAIGIGLSGDGGAAVGVPLAVCTAVALVGLLAPATSRSFDSL